MAIWDKAKDASVEARRRDEEYHARAMHEIQSGQRRDGLWAKAVTSTNGNEAVAKLMYFKLLVQAIKDDDHVAMRSFQSQSNVAKEPSFQPPSQSLAAQKPSLLKAVWFWLLAVLATLILVFGFLPVIFDGKATFVQWLIAGFWLVVIHYALKKAVPVSQDLRKLCTNDPQVRIQQGDH